MLAHGAPGVLGERPDGGYATARIRLALKPDIGFYGTNMAKIKSPGVTLSPEKHFDI